MLSVRKLVVSATVAATAMAGTLVIAPEAADAHGATMFPGSRQFFCWVDGLQDDGQIIPANPACQDAVAQSGTTHLFNWFANLHPAAAGQTVGFIPDGRICDGGGGGPFDFEPYNMARLDWPRTHLTAGDTYEFQHNNWADHPGRFDVYLTTEGYDPTQPLTWDDLELIHSEQDPPATGPPGGLEYYFWDVTFPQDRTGLHLMFTHWVRSDSPENFYSCSDVIFDGGNGEVTGIGEDPGPPDIDPPDPNDPPTVPGPAFVSNITPTSAELDWGASGGFVSAYELVNIAGGQEEVLATVTGEPPPTFTTLTELTPETDYEIAVRARNDNTGVVTELSDGAAFTTPGPDDVPPPGECTVDYNVVSDWGQAFHVEVTVTNDGDQAIGGWQVGWSFPGAQQIDQLWNGIVSQDGQDVTVVNETWNPNLPADGGSVTVGFLASPGGGADPTAFTLNGTTCALA